MQISPPLSFIFTNLQIENDFFARPGVDFNLEKAFCRFVSNSSFLKREKKLRKHFYGMPICIFIWNLFNSL